MPNQQTHNNTPALRFPDFLNDGEWEVKRLGEIAELTAGATPLTTKIEYWENGSIPWMSSGEVHNGQIFDTEKRITQIGYDNCSTKLVPANSVVVALAGQGKTRGTVAITRIELCTNQSLCSILPNESFNSDFLYFYLSSKYEVLRQISSGDGTRGGLNLQMLRDFPIPLPPLPEQRRIAQALTALDELIAATNEKLEQVKAYKKGLMQKLFPAKGKKLPELRFKEFENDGEWIEKKLGEVTKVVNRRNKSNRNLPIYSISNKDGFILQSEQFDGLDSVSRGYDISLYKIVTSHTFAYNPARINVGSIGYSGNIKECLISSLYVCFKTTEEIDDSFLMYFFDTLSFNQSVENNVEGGIRAYLFYENFSKIKIQFPSISEQKRIASCLKAVDEEIIAISNKASELEKQKKGLMQKLFPITKNN